MDRAADAVESSDRGRSGAGAEHVQLLNGTAAGQALTNALSEVDRVRVMAKDRRHAQKQYAHQSVRRSRTRRVGESAYGRCCVARTWLMGRSRCCSWWRGCGRPGARRSTRCSPRARERGTMTVSACARRAVHGPVRAAGGRGPAAGEGVDRRRSAAPDKGERLAVAVKPGTDEVGADRGRPGFCTRGCRSAGSLLLAALVVAGGLRLRRTAWVMGLLGGGAAGARRSRRC